MSVVSVVSVVSVMSVISIKMYTIVVLKTDINRLFT